MKVICIDAKPRWTSVPLVEGAAYTAIGHSERGGILLAEVKARPPSDGSFFADRFKPMTTDISIFTDMLEPQRNQEVIG